MQSEKIFKILTTPYSALISVLFGMMILAFPIGAYVFFNTDLGKEITYEYPLNSIDFFIAGLSLKIPIQIEVGDAFVVLWSLYLVLFTISIFGSAKSFLKSLSLLATEGWKHVKTNYLLGMLTWFSILILFSVSIDTIQQNLGIPIEPPKFQNLLIQFYQVTLSPITEEAGFRLMLVGLPLFALYSSTTSFKHFIGTLWHPSKNLQITNYKKIIIIIVVVGIFFGIAHIISGTPWSSGKFSQAVIAGIILGGVYVRYGFVSAVLLHWSTNYFIYAYTFFMSDTDQISITDTFSNPFLNMLEILLVITGALALTLLTMNYLKSKRESTELTSV